MINKQDIPCIYLTCSVNHESTNIGFSSKSLVNCNFFNKILIQHVWFKCTRKMIKGKFYLIREKY